VFEYNILLSMPSTSGSDHSSGYDNNVHKVVLMGKISLTNMYLKKNEADWISPNARN
jgi:hypothetical protein